MPVRVDSPTPQKAKRRNSHSKQRVRKSKKDHTLNKLLHSPEGAAHLGAMMRVHPLETSMALTPPGSFLEGVLRVIRNETDCPPELGIVTVFAVMSAALCQAGSTFSFFDDPRPNNPALWLVAMAESGAGKSLIRNIVTEALQVNLNGIPDPGSGEALLDTMAEVGGIGYWDRDEYGQKIKAISRDSSMATLKDFLLQCYDGRTLENTTRKHGTKTVEEPCLVIYGSTPDDSFGSCIDAEMLVDGFAARHLYAVMEQTPLSVHRYSITKAIDQLREYGVDSLVASLGEQRHFVITEAADNEFRARFKELMDQLAEAPGLRRGFVRRVTWAAGTYAVMYHLLTHADPGDRVGATSMRWAWRMVTYHLYSARRALALADPGVATKLERMMSWVDGQRADGVDTTTKQFVRRFFQRFSRDISSISEARQMLAVCGVRA